MLNYDYFFMECSRPLLEEEKALIKDLLNKTNDTFVILQETEKADITISFH